MSRKDDPLGETRIGKGSSGSTSQAVPDVQVDTTSPSSPSFPSRFTQYSSSILADFLIRRSISNLTLGNYFYWYLKVECEDTLSGSTYNKVIQQYLTALEKVHPERKDVLKRQGKLVRWLGSTAKELQTSKDTRPRKEEIFRQRITDQARQMTNFEELPLPMDPKIRVTGIIPGRVWMEWVDEHGGSLHISPFSL